jgi:DNA gyrase subunit A
MEVVKAGEQLLTVTTNGYGKRTPVEEYPRHSRGGQGVVTHKVTDRTGPVAIARMVNPMQELIVISADGIVLRTRLDSIANVGRGSQGVQVMRVSPGDRVASIATIDMAAPAPKHGAALDREGDGQKPAASRGRVPAPPSGGRAGKPATPKKAPPTKGEPSPGAMSPPKPPARGQAKKPGSARRPGA